MIFWAESIHESEKVDGQNRLNRLGWTVVDWWDIVYLIISIECRVSSKVWMLARDFNTPNFWICICWVKWHDSWQRPKPFVKVNQPALPSTQVAGFTANLISMGGIVSWPPQCHRDVFPWDQVWQLHNKGLIIYLDMAWAHRKSPHFP